MIVALAAAAAVASCNEATAPIPTPELDEALDEIAEAEALVAPGLVMMGVAPPPSGGPAACVYNAGNKRFECPPFTANGITATRYYQLLDATGAPQSAWSTSVVAIKNVMDASGTITSSTASQNMGTVQLTSHDESTLSGLRSETKTLTGTGTATYTITSAQGGSSTANMTRTTSLSMPKPGPDAYPTGTTTMTMTVDGSSTPTMTMTMTFDGTSIVRMTSTIGNTTRTCTHDLKAPQTPPVCS